jgi:hypothetical protein
MCPLEKLEVAILAVDIDDTTATRECNENYIYRQGCGIAPTRGIWVQTTFLIKNILHLLQFCL